MRFALLGNHPDGLDMACALVATGHHQLGTFTGAAAAIEGLRRRGLSPAIVGDLEEVLADPSIEAVIVASGPGVRPEHLRRALQSERHVLCVHPADQSPDIGYEAAMIQGDTHQVLLPLLPEALHPVIARLAELTGTDEDALGPVRLIEMERWSPEASLAEAGARPDRLSFRGWDVLRKLRGEIAEVSAFAATEEAAADAPLLLAGRFERGGLFQITLLPGQYEGRRRLMMIGQNGQAELEFPEGWPGPARLTWQGKTGDRQEAIWPTWDPWPVLVEIFEDALRQGGIKEKEIETGGTSLSWQDAVRCLELDDATRRSVERRRASTLEYQDVSEEVGFKGTMTLVGCAMLWGMVLLLILSRWFPKLGWIILPLLVVFLALQLLRWVVPGGRSQIEVEERTRS